MKRAKLYRDLQDRLAIAAAAIASLDTIQFFVVAACEEAASAKGSPLSLRLNDAAQLLPASLDELAPEKGSLKKPDHRVPSFLQMQLFISLVATVEGLLYDLASLVLLAIPGKLDKDLAVKKSTVIEAESLSDVKHDLVEQDLNEAFYAKPEVYRGRIESILSMPDSVLASSWDAFIENKATRDVGLHNSWRTNATYTRKAKKLARRPDRQGNVYPDALYFKNACNNARQMIDALKVHWNTTFRKFRKADTFQFMWTRSALGAVVSFERAWSLSAREDMVRPVADFRWNWSSTETLVWEFFKHIYHGKPTPDFVRIRERWAGTETAVLINEWLESPFHF